MQKKINSRFRLIDLTIVILCIAGSAASGTVFWQEYNRTLTKLNDDPVGTIVFKRRTAERRFIDRVIWDRLRDTSSVYNGDTIRTIELSEAVLTFKDDVTRLTLNENTLIQIFYDEINGARVDFTGGRMEIASPREVLVTSGSSLIRIEGQANLNKSDEGFNISVLQGSVVFNGEVIEKGEIFALNAAGQRDYSPVIAMTSFGSSARVLSEEGMPVPVMFTWNSSNFTPDIFVIIEIARDGGFNNIIESSGSGSNSALISMENGNYWWRAYPTAGSGPLTQMYPSGTLEIISASPVSLVSPAVASEITSSDSGIPFSWTAAQGVSSYILEISSNSNMSNPVVSKVVEGTNITLGHLDINAWHWRVTPLLPSWITGSLSPSPISGFSVVSEIRPSSPPELVFPLPYGNIYLDSGGQTLIWALDSNTASWIVEIADNALFNNSAVRQTVTSNFFSLPEQILQDGKTWYWQVSALGGAGLSVSQSRSFNVIARMPFIEPEPVVVPEPEADMPQDQLVQTPEPVLTQPAQPITPVPAQSAFTQQPSSALPATAQPAPAQSVTTPVSRPAQQQPVQPESVPPIEPAPVQPQPEPVQPEPVPQPIQTQPEPAQPPAFPEGHPVIVPLTTEENIIEGLIKVSPAGAVFNAFPADGYILSHEQLRNVLSIVFSWHGNASEYLFALYKSTGEALVPPVPVTGASFDFNDLNSLTEGNYVWQVFEKDNQGRWIELPSIAQRLIITSGALRTLPSSNPGALYGNR